MVNIGTAGVATCVDTWFITVPCWGINTDRDRPFGNEGFDQTLILVGFDVHERLELGDRGSLLCIESTRVVLTLVRNVWVCPFRCDTTGVNDMLESDLSSSSMASSGSSAMFWVWCTTSNLLFWEILKVASSDSPVGL
jgi:hypothetical protein